MALRYPYKVVGTAADGSEIRKFADERIASAIDDAIDGANLKPDQHVALIVTYKDDSKPGPGIVRGAVMFRKTIDVFGKTIDWSFGGIVWHDFSTGDTTKEAGTVLRF